MVKREEIHITTTELTLKITQIEATLHQDIPAPTYNELDWKTYSEQQSYAAGNVALREAGFERYPLPGELFRLLVEEEQRAKGGRFYNAAWEYHLKEEKPKIQRLGATWVAAAWHIENKDKYNLLTIYTEPDIVREKNSKLAIITSKGIAEFALPLKMKTVRFKEIDPERKDALDSRIIYFFFPWEQGNCAAEFLGTPYENPRIQFPQPGKLLPITMNTKTGDIQPQSMDHESAYIAVRRHHG